MRTKKCPQAGDGNHKWEQGRCRLCGLPKPKTSMDIARDKGRTAFLSGADRATNPYADVKQARGSPTFALAYRNAWFDGYDRAVRKESSAAPRSKKKESSSA